MCMKCDLKAVIHRPFRTADLASTTIVRKSGKIVRRAYSWIWPSDAQNFSRRWTVVRLSHDGITNFNIPADDWTVARRKCLVPITKYDFSYARHWHVAVDITIARGALWIIKHHRATIGWFTRWVFARCFPRHPHNDHRAMHHRPAVSKFLWITPLSPFRAGCCTLYIFGEFCYVYRLTVYQISRSIDL